MVYFLPGHRLCAGCGAAINVRMLLNVCEKCGYYPICCVATGCLEVATTIYPNTNWNCPFIHNAFENAASTASGVYRAIKILREKYGEYNDKKYHVIAIAGDGGTFDIGFQALSGMLERGEDVLFFCYDNEAYMNTGIQRSSATPLYAWTTTTPGGKKERKKDLILICAMHKIPYAATVCFAYLSDFEEKVKKALDYEGPTVIHAISPCVAGWRYEPELTVEIAKLAVETGIFPLIEWENGKLKITYKPKFIPVEEYLKLQGRFKHLTKEQIEKIQENVYKYWEFLENLSKI